jgi:uncharacterized membrane protein
MRTRSTLTRAAFATAVAAAIGFGVTSASAAPAAEKRLSCPGYMSSAQACSDCCANWYGAYGLWSPSSGYCACAL